MFFLGNIPRRGGRVCVGDKLAGWFEMSGKKACPTAEEHGRRLKNEIDASLGMHDGSLGQAWMRLRSVVSLSAQIIKLKSRKIGVLNWLWMSDKKLNRFISIVYVVFHGWNALRSNFGIARALSRKRATESDETVSLDSPQTLANQTQKDRVES